MKNSWTKHHLSPDKNPSFNEVQAGVAMCLDLANGKRLVPFRDTSSTTA